MSAIQVTLIVLILVVGVSIIRKFGNMELSIIKKYEKEGLERFEKLINSIGPIDKLRFFSDGHPYVWVEISYEEAKKKVLLSCRGFRNVPIPASFQSKADIEKFYLYIVIPRNRKFDWMSLQHYEEWLENNEPIAERIAAYKNEQ